MQNTELYRIDRVLEGAPSADDVRAQLERILSSPEFTASIKRRAFLRFIVEETLAGRADRLKGFSVAVAVFGRDESFDSQADPVVRFEARRLRRDLDSYYMDAGSQDPVRISIPKGHYVPRFDMVEQPTSAEPLEGTGPDPSPSQAGIAGPPIPPPAGYAGWPRMVAALAAVVLFSAALESWLWLRNDASNPADTRGPAVMVLPFEALDSSDETRLIASAMTQDLISDLMRFPDFRLYSAETSFQLDANTIPVEFDRENSVSYVVRGNVQSSQGDLRLDAQLVENSTGQVLWNTSIVRVLDPDDLIAMRSELSSTVATALGEPYGVVKTDTVLRLTAEGAVDMESYTCVLRAYEYRRTFEDALFAPALACLEKAVVQNPDYADAWAMLGWIHLDAARQDMVPAAEHPRHMAAAHEAASRAVKLDPGNQRGLEALAAILFSNGDYAESERLQRAALALNPHDPEALAQLGWRLAVRGNWSEGLPLLERAISRSASPPGWYFHMIAVHEYLEGNYAASLAAAEHSSKVGSAIGLSLAAISHAGLRNMEAAREDLAQMSSAWPLLANDPAAAYRSFQVVEPIVAALVDGLRAAGWTPPGRQGNKD